MSSYYFKNKQRLALYHAAYRRKNRERLRRWARKNMRDCRIGKGAQAYFEKCWKQQKGKCALCGQKIKKRPHLDHCHKTGILRAILCVTCNRGLGFFKDDVKLLKRAIAYLKKYKG